MSSSSCRAGSHSALDRIPLALLLSVGGHFGTWACGSSEHPADSGKVTNGSNTATVYVCQLYITAIPIIIDRP